MERDIFCEHCNKHITKTDMNDTDAAALINYKKIGVAKATKFFDIDGIHFFCCSDCYINWLNEHTTKEQIEKAEAKVREIKRKLALNQKKIELLKLHHTKITRGKRYV